MIFALVATAASAQAAHGPTELVLTTQDKDRLTKILGEALRDNYIGKAQYDESISWVNSTPCDGVDRSLGKDRQEELQEAIARQQQRASVKVFDSFASGGWFVFFTDASDGDEPYLFYSGDPRTGAAPLTAWSGAATIFETGEVARWAQQNAPGIPAKLANCFAWHVTLSPE